MGWMDKNLEYSYVYRNKASTHYYLTDAMNYRRRNELQEA